MLTNDGPGRTATAGGVQGRWTVGRPSELAADLRLVGRSGQHRYMLALATSSFAFSAESKKVAVKACTEAL